MKEKKRLIFKKIQWACMLFTCTLISLNVSAQNSKSISGAVVDATGEPVIGASISVKGTTTGTVTDIDGNFQLTATDHAVLIVSSIGYVKEEVPVNGKSALHIVLKEDTQLLGELVVIGYGTIKKSDATGSVELLTAKDMNKGPIVTVDNLITGRMPGVAVIPNGNPGTGSQIRIRGGASLDASNDPLIVVDGLPLQNMSISQINPNDIETFSVLKDASAATIYGSRASNGVILITTKRGSDSKWKFNVDLQGNVNTVPWTVNTLSQPDFIKAVTDLGPSAASLLGYNKTMYNTDWQKEIFQTAVAYNTNISAMGKIGSFMPARISAGYNYTPGILITSGYQRSNMGVALNPTFFNKTLKIDVNANGSHEVYNVADEGTIGTAAFFDPTKPVYVNGSYNPGAPFLGYYEWLDASGNPINLAPRNPVAMLNETNRTNNVWKLWGNVQFDYAFPFVKGLDAIVNLGLQTEKWNEDYFGGKTAGRMATVNGVYQSIGSEWHNNGNSTNRVLDAYLKYNNTFDFFKLDLTGGYSYQKYQIGTEYQSGDLAQITNGLLADSDVKHDWIYTPKVLISFFGRANLSFYDKYLLTLTMRNDRSSLFAPDKRSGIFPAASFAWRINEEGLMKEQKVFSNLKLRLGWGVTGQQNLFVDERYTVNYYLPLYAIGVSSFSQYPMNGTPTTQLYPLPYNPDLTWEKTTTYNAGLDFGFANNRVYGSFDVYYKESKDLLASVMVPAGNFANAMFMNAGAFSTKGAELGLNWDVVRNPKQGELNWSLGYNIAFNRLKITDYPALASNGRSQLTRGGGGFPLSIFEVGYAPYTYYVFKQVYDTNGKPLEGIFADRNGNGKLDNGDKYYCHSPNPDAIMGLSTNLSYKNFDYSMAWRASIGNYIYNYMKAMNSYRTQLNPSGVSLYNIVSTEYSTPDDNKCITDEWIENGSFLKWDNATLGYNIKQIAVGVDLRIYFSVQNILTITKADVNDPEVSIGGDMSGVVRNLYPRPRTFLLGFNLNF